MHEGHSEHTTIPGLLASVTLPILAEKACQDAENSTRCFRSAIAVMVLVHTGKLPSWQ